MDPILLNIWRAHNAGAFEGKLVGPNAIDWAEIGGEEGIGAHGAYFRFTNSIAIDERFRFDVALLEEGDGAGEIEAAKCEVAARLVMHEMVHQAQYQFREKGAGGHGESFISIATIAAQALDMPAPTTKEEAERWPEILPFVARYNLLPPTTAAGAAPAPPPDSPRKPLSE